MELEAFLPQYDVIECHQNIVIVTPERAYQVFKKIDFSESKLIRSLFHMRGLSIDKQHSMFESFTIIYEEAHREIMWGMIVQVWKWNVKPLSIEAHEFNQFDEPDYAKIAWNFTFDGADGETRVATETRVRCPDSNSREKFRIYWFFVKPFEWTPETRDAASPEKVPYEELTMFISLNDLA